MREAPGIGARLQNGLEQLDAGVARTMIERVREAARENGMWMEEREASTVVPICLRPGFVDPATLGYVHHATWQMRRALQRLPGVVAEDSQARELLSLTDVERKWFEQYRPASLHGDSRYCRLDALFRTGSPGRPAQFEFIEPNVVGLGGMCYAIDTVDILERFVFPEIWDAEGDDIPQRADDPRELLFLELMEFSRGRGFGENPTVVLLGSRNGYETDGEDRRLVDWLRRRGLDTLFADPRELEIGTDGVIFAEGRRVDVIYRMMELSDLVEIEQKEGELGAVRAAFDQQRVTPTVGGDLEQKSVFELFTNDRYADHFTPTQQEVFRRHVLWTRLLTDRETTGPGGESVALPSFAREHRSELVLKPNRSYGGTGVLIGPQTSAREWDQAIESAISGSSELVVQRLAKLVEEELPIQTDDAFETRAVYTVIGVFPSRYGVGVLGRYSDEPVVNVTRSGGVVPYMVDFS